MEAWEQEFSDSFEGTIEDYTHKKIKEFIWKQIKLAEDRGFFSKLRTIGCYSIKETKELVKQAQLEVIDKIIKESENLHDFFDTMEYLEAIKKEIDG